MLLDETPAVLTVVLFQTDSPKKQKHRRKFFARTNVRNKNIEDELLFMQFNTFQYKNGYSVNHKSGFLIADSC